MAIVNELITSLGFKLDQKSMATIEAVENAIGKIVKVADKLGKTFTVAKGLMDYFTGVAVKDAKEIRDNAKTFGISTEAYQRWGHAAKVAGVSAERLYEDLKNLKNIKGFTDQGIIDWMNKLSSANFRDAMAELRELGLSEDFLKLIKTQGGTGGVLKLLADAGPLLSDEEVENAAQFAENMNSLMSHLDMMKRKAFIQLSPEFNKQIETIDKWLKENDYFIKEITEAGKALSKGFADFFKIIKQIYDWIKEKLQPIFGSMIKDMVGTEEAAKAITAALLVMTGAKVITGLASLTTAMAAFVRAAWPLLVVAHGMDMVMTEFENWNNPDKNTQKRTALGQWFYDNVTKKAMKKIGIKPGSFLIDYNTGMHVTSPDQLTHPTRPNVSQKIINNIYPANNQQLEQTVQQVNGFQTGGNGFVGQPAS